MIVIVECHLNVDSFVPLMDHIFESYIELRIAESSLSSRCYCEFSAMTIEKFLLDSGFKEVLSSVCAAYKIKPLWVDFEKTGESGTSYFTDDSL